MLKKFACSFALLVCLALPSAAGAATPMLALSSSVPSGGHSCLLTQSGKVYCWGDNSRGELGTSAGLSDSNGIPTPQLVPLPGAAVQVAAGDSHSCALLATGSAYCWGLNHAGQIGTTVNNGTLNANPTPNLVPTGGPVSSIAAGDLESCFIYPDGSAKCVGENDFGQLAFPNQSIVATPTAMQLGGAAVKKIAIGGNFACEQLVTLTVKCQGFNPSGQLANNAHLGSGGSTPVTAGLSGPAIDLDIGNGQGCAVLQDQTTWCWGTNSLGQLGVGSADDGDHYTPLKVSIGAARQLALGGTFSCVKLVSAAIDCWGGNLFGQLGVPDNILTFNPNPTPLLSGLDGNAIDVASGGGFSCAISGDGSVRCVGDNSDSQLGVAEETFDHSYIPVTLAGINVFDVPPAASKLQLAPSKPKVKYKKSGGRISATARVAVNGVGTAISSAQCTGKASAKFERKSGKKYKKIVSQSPKLSIKKGVCGFDVKMKLAKKYGGKKLYLHLKLPDGASTLGFDKRYSAKVKKLKF